MSTRALKKLYRDELSPSPNPKPRDFENEEGTEVEEEGEEESEQESPVTSKPNPFALLEGDNEDDDSEKEEEAEAVVVPEPVKSSEASNRSGQSPAAGGKKKKKKNKKKQNTGVSSKKDKSEDDEKDSDIDQLISQMESSTSLERGRSPTYLKFLHLDTKDLDYEQEFRKLFGKQALKESQTQASDSESAFRNSIRSASGATALLLNSWGGRDGRTFPGSSRKLVLAKIKSHYAPTIKRDILMDQLSSSDSSNGIIDFKFVHSPEYKEAQMIYEYSRSMGDFQMMVNQVMSKTPYHVPTLLLLADNRAQTGNHSEAADFLEQALLTFDRGLKSNFNFTTGQCRLPFKYFENRTFYLTVFEYIKSLMKRGTWQTAFAYTKLLWGCEPDEDPYGAGFMIDFFAMNADNYQYLIDIADEPFFSQAGTVYYTRPNLWYSRALAYFTKTKGNDISTSTKYLQTAVSKFPWVAADILGYHTPDDEEYNYDGLFQPSVLDKINSRPDGAKSMAAGPEQSIYSSLYAVQMKSFWENPKARKLLQEVCKSSSLILEPIHQSIGVSLSLVRYAMLSQQTQTYRYIPAEMLSGELWADDLLPPVDNISPYPERTRGSAAA